MICRSCGRRVRRAVNAWIHVEGSWQFCPALVPAVEART